VRCGLGRRAFEFGAAGWAKIGLFLFVLRSVETGAAGERYTWHSCGAVWSREFLNGV
jgi:hypothetical protein